MHALPHIWWLSSASKNLCLLFGCLRFCVGSSLGLCRFVAICFAILLCFRPAVVASVSILTPSFLLTILRSPSAARCHGYQYTTIASLIQSAAFSISVTQERFPCLCSSGDGVLTTSGMTLMWLSSTHLAISEPILHSPRHLAIQESGSPASRFRVDHRRPLHLNTSPHFSGPFLTHSIGSPLFRPTFQSVAHLSFPSHSLCFVNLSLHPQCFPHFVHPFKSDPFSHNHFAFRFNTFIRLRFAAFFGH